MSKRKPTRRPTGGGERAEPDSPRRKKALGSQNNLTSTGTANGRRTIAAPASGTPQGLPATSGATAATTGPEKKKKKNTAEENRGRQFLGLMKMWRLLHEDRGLTLFNKQLLAERYFAEIERDEEPEPEIIVETNDEDWDEDGDDFLAHHAGRGRQQRTPTPYKWIKERHLRYVQRTIEMLRTFGVGVERYDERGKFLDDDAFQDRHDDDPAAVRWWRYDPHGPWAEEFDTLLNAHGVTGQELLGFMALRDLLEDMRGTPHHRALQQQLDKMMRCVPPKLREEAIEQSRSYRHSVGSTAKYVRKSGDLERWYTAALMRQQVEIAYATPGCRPRTRHLAALSTVFNREENSLYFLASEKLAGGWGPVRQWKVDRVEGVRLLRERNPPLAVIPRHPLVRAAPGAGPERLDANRLYDHSGGAWLQDGVEATRLEVLVRVPRVDDPGLGEPGVDETALAELRESARRRAHGWMHWCCEKPFHPRQVATMETTADGEGRLRLVVERCYPEEMASRLLRLQDCFEVVEPPELAAIIRRTADAISRGHGGQR
jgi:predicted DNA-binding transcriptional regulator YafY